MPRTNGDQESEPKSAGRDKYSHYISDSQKGLEKPLIDAETQTFSVENKPISSTKFYKEIETQTSGLAKIYREAPSQTDPYTPSISSKDLQENMNQILAAQLSKHLAQNLEEIASMKRENGRLLEKCKQEQKQNARLKEEVKRMQ